MQHVTVWNARMLVLNFISKVRQGEDVQFVLIKNGKGLERNASIILNAVTLDHEAEEIKDSAVSLFFRLRCLDVIKTSSAVKVYAKKADGEWYLFGATEAVENDSNPTFEKEFEIDTTMLAKLRFSIFESTKGALPEKNLLGIHEIKVMNMITGKGAYYPFRNDKNPKFDQSLLDKNTRVGFSCTVTKGGIERDRGDLKIISLSVKCNGLPVSKANPQVCLDVKDVYTREWEYIGQTECIKNDVNLEFKTPVMVQTQPHTHLRAHISTHTHTHIHTRIHIHALRRM
jgi:hypothetical protein